MNKERKREEIIISLAYLVTLIQIEIALNGVPKTNQRSVRVVCEFASAIDKKKIKRDREKCMYTKVTK